MSDFGLVVAVSVVGGVGSALRYLVDNAVPLRGKARYPWGTTLVNVTGSFALGVLTGFAAFSETWQIILGTGLIGGYTTFSTASLETVRLLADRRPGRAAANGLGLIVVCVLASIVGITITRS